MTLGSGAKLRGAHGEYQIVDRISAGGMAEVFRARRQTADGNETVVALKRILPSIATHQQFVTMFVDEAKIAARLDHRNIVKVVDVGLDGGDYFIAMEYVRGVDVKTLMERCKDAQVGIPLSLTCTIVSRVCDALSYAHHCTDSQGRPMRVVHRDVTPANVLLSYDGEIKLIDFGVAKAENRLAQTKTGILKGKLAYVAPELVLGAPADHRCDVFAAGVVLWEMLTGARLFDAKTDVGTLELVRLCRPPLASSRNPEVPPELDGIVARALAKDPSQRYQDAIELHDALQDFVGLATTGWTARRIARWLEVASDEDKGKTQVFRVRGKQPMGLETALASLDDGVGSQFDVSDVADTSLVEVSFDSDPGGATVYLVSDGGRRKVGTTPVTIELDTNLVCDVSVRKRGYTSWSHTLELRGTDPVDLLAKLERAEDADDSGVAVARPPGGRRDIATERTVGRGKRASRLPLLFLLLAVTVGVSVVGAPELWREVYVLCF